MKVIREQAAIAADVEGTSPMKRGLKCHPSRWRSPFNLALIQGIRWTVKGVLCLNCARS